MVGVFVRDDRLLLFLGLPGSGLGKRSAEPLDLVIGCLELN